MDLREDDIKDLGLDIGEEVKPMAVRCSVCESSNCLNRCEHSCQKCEWCQSACEKSAQCNECNYDCQSNAQARCQNDCQSACEKSCQTCQTTCERGCESASQKNSAPNAPTTITIASEAKAGDSINISWSTAADPDGNLAGYMLEKKTDNAGFVQIYKGSNRSFNDTIALGVSKVVYRVRSYDTLGAVSPYKESTVVTVINNLAPVISGKDEDLGGKKSPFKINVSVSDRENDSVNLVAKLNGSVIKTINNIKLDTNYEIELDAKKFNVLVLNARNELEISASDGKAESFRRYTFTRVNAAPEITLSKTNYAEQNSPFSFDYTIKDQENDKVSVRILYVDKVLEHKKDVALGEKQTFKFTKLDFAKIPAGEISIKIEATDEKGGVSSKLVTFKKAINGCGYIFKKDTAKNATQVIVSVSRKIDEKSTFKAYVCNNANDEKPTWEEMTDMLDKIYTLKNASKTASGWAIGAKAEVVRGEGAGDSYLEAIGINYR